MLSGESEDTIHEEIMSKGGLGTAMLHGDVTNGIISVNTGISCIHAIKPVAEIVEELMSDFQI